MMRYTSRNMPISKLQTVLGILFTGAVGTFLHFLFRWSYDHPAVALFSAVNESTWEHLKLLFFPVLLFTLLECMLFGRRVPGFLWARTLALLSGMALIVAGFYTYSGILGDNYFIADITLFIASILTTFFLTIAIQKWRRNFPAHTALAVLILIALTALFFIFTFYPPHIGLFLDPVTNTYGIPGPRA